MAGRARGRGRGRGRETSGGRGTLERNFSDSGAKKTK